jgi:adenylate cyclase
MNGDDRVRELEAILARKSNETSILARVAVEMASTLELDALLTRVLSLLDEVFGFRHSMVLLHDAPRGVLVVRASRGYSESGIGAEVEIGQGVIGVVAKRRKLLRMGGVSAQRGYLEASAQQTSHATPATKLPGLPDTMSVVAIPLVKGEELIGVFHVESADRAAFDDADQSLIEAVASLAAVAIQNAEWNESSRRFVPHEFLGILGRSRLTDVQRGDHAELVMSTFFSDVRGYTKMVEGQGAPENFAFINEYLTYMEAPIVAHRGFVDSYRGDGIVALFAGSPNDAVRAAVESLDALRELNEVREHRGDPPIRIGIGIDTGLLMLGTVGGAMRLSAGVIGDSANTASRIEELTKRYAATILISERTREGCEVDRYRMRAIDRVRPQGKTNAITLYEVLDGLPEPELAGKLSTREEFELGLRHYQAGEPGAGLVHFASALKAFPSDRAAQLYVGRCWHFIEHGVPEGWDGVTTMTAK